jgi:hypothetical protein
MLGNPNWIHFRCYTCTLLLQFFLLFFVIFPESYKLKLKDITVFFQKLSCNAQIYMRIINVIFLERSFSRKQAHIHSVHDWCTLRHRRHKNTVIKHLKRKKKRLHDSIQVHFYKTMVVQSINLFLKVTVFQSRVPFRNPYTVQPWLAGPR